MTFQRVSVSRAVKPLVEDVHPADYFSQKNCALQYSSMLDKAGTPKRKRTSEGAPEIGELIGTVHTFCVWEVYTVLMNSWKCHSMKYQLLLQLRLQSSRL